MDFEKIREVLNFIGELSKPFYMAVRKQVIVNNVAWVVALLVLAIVTVVVVSLIYRQQVKSFASCCQEHAWYAKENTAPDKDIYNIVTIMIVAMWLLFMLLPVSALLNVDYWTYQRMIRLFGNLIK